MRRVAPMLVALSLGACAEREKATPAAVRAGPVAIQPPNELTGELSVLEPRQLWQALRRLGGPRAEVLPSSWELLLFGALSLPPRLAGFVAENTRLIAVFLAPPGGEPAWVLGLRVANGAELVQALGSGSGAAFRVERDGSPVTFLVGSAGPALGVVGDALLVARRRSELALAGPYVAHVLGARSEGAEPLVLELGRGALSGSLASAVKKRWAESRSALVARDREARVRHGRNPDFGEPAAVLELADGAVGGLVELLAGARQLRVVVRPADDRLELELSLLAEPKGSLERATAELSVGGLEPLWEAPQDSVVALFSRSRVEERSASAAEPSAALRAVLGPRLGDKDGRRLAAAFASYERGRGELRLFGLSADRSVFLRQEARDPAELERGFLGMLGVLRTPALAAPLEPWIGKLAQRESEVTIPGVEGAARRVALMRRNGGPAGRALVLQVRGERAWLVAGAAPEQKLAQLAGVPSVAALGDLPELRALARDGSPAAHALYADLALLAPDGARAPALALLGRAHGKLRLELDLSRAACAVLVERATSP